MPKTLTKNAIIAFLSNIPETAQSSLKFSEDGRDYRTRFSMESPLVSMDFDSPDIGSGSIAYHPVFGNIFYRACYSFSTEKFIANLRAAEENPAIVAHIIHVNSGGGEAYGCHEAFEVVKGLKKPCYGIIDTCAASAGYYLVAGADKIYASSMFSEVGCIGVMSVLYNFDKAYEQEGIKIHEYYSNYSPLKNKVFNDASHGDGEEFVKRFLDPMAYRFIEDVKSVRKSLTEEAEQGETYYAADAVAAGLIDGENTLDEVIAMILNDSSVSQIDINQIQF